MLDECDVLLRDGGIAHVRPLRTADRTALHELVDRTSERSAYLRFFTGGRATAHAYVDRLTGPGHPGHALVAFVHGTMAGVAEHIPNPGDDSADLGILLDDTTHGRGLGTLLLEHLAEDAAARGYQELRATVLFENGPMLRVLRDVGLDVEQRVKGTEVEIRIGLRETPRLRDAIAARDHEAERASLARLLSPRSVAVIGASRDPASVGHRVVRNLVDGGFAGPIYPVNPKTDRLAGLACHPSVTAVPGPVDLAVVAVPARHVLDVARDCARAGVAGLVVLTAGFAENGHRGSERELLAICREAGMRLVGPNCLGITNSPVHLNATFLPAAPAPGPVGLISQSGAVAAAVLARLGELGLGVSSFVSSGNKADVSGNDLLEYWDDDDATKVVALYLESFGNPRKFARIARRVGRKKPILLVKSGRTGSGDRAVRSHTAAAATPDVAVDALVRASGVIRLDSVQELLDTARLLAAQPLPRGPRVAIVGNSGGPEAMAADACERQGLVVPELYPETRRRLAERVRTAAALGNPVDLTADAAADEIGFAVQTVLADPGVDMVLAVYTPPFGSGRAKTEEAIAAAALSSRKTVLACLVGHDGVIGERIPSYAFPEQAALAAAKAAQYARERRRPDPEPGPALWCDAQAARAIVHKELSAHPQGRWLDPVATAHLLACYGVSLAESIGVDGPETAAEAAALTGLPAVLKATGPQLVHKSDVGGVSVGLQTPEEVRRAYREMAERVGPAMTGAIVQRMVPDGVEMIVGGVAYETFGPLLMVGLGGVTADLTTDRVFRVPPVGVADAAEMIRELRCAPLLYGYRGRPPRHAAALAEQIARVGRLMSELPEVAELDLNPVIVTERGATAVDARIRLAPCVPPPSPLLRRLR